MPSKPKRSELATTFKPRFWDELDGRRPVTREINRRYEVLRQDTGAESMQREMLCQQAVFISVCLETMQHEAVATGEFDAGVYTQMSNALLGLLKTLGLERHVKKAGGLRDYIRERQADAAESAA